MKKTYIIPSITVDVAEMADELLVLSIRMSGGSGDEEYVKEFDSDDDWDED